MENEFKELLPNKEYFKKHYVNESPYEVNPKPKEKPSISEYLDDIDELKYLINRKDFITAKERFIDLVRKHGRTAKLTQLIHKIEKEIKNVN